MKEVKLMTIKNEIQLISIMERTYTTSKETNFKIINFLPDYKLIAIIENN